jgi:hypothetical protein
MEEFKMVSFLPLNIADEDSMEYVRSSIDYIFQYDEDAEPKEPPGMNDPEDQDAASGNWQDFVACGTADE